MSSALSKGGRLFRRLTAPLRHRLLFARYHFETMIPKGPFIANLQLAERVHQLPGCIVECGVWRGGMSAAIAEVLGPDRQYHLFDSFAGLPPAQSIDGLAALRWQSMTDHPDYHENCSATAAQATATFLRSGCPHFTLHQGWFADTVPTATDLGPISLLRLDGDWYESTLTCLRYLYPQVASSGLTLIDDYYTWDGCARATHDYLSEARVTDRLTHHHGIAHLQKTAPP